ncbi:hypothetical protein MHU86_13591 [Fragilaria crotonensis]|nr:hypothetical protein MHU86_13591 [Fragilaria crotonensis]
MVNYVAADGDITAPFDALKNAVLPFKKHSFSYVATTNTSSIAESNTYRPKKSPKQAPGHFQRTATALTPEQESAVISRFLETIDQERLQDTDTNNRVNYACELSYEAGSTDMGRSHSLSIKPGAINDIAAAELQDIQDIYARNTFASTIIPRQEDLQLASYERPIKNQRVRFNFNVETIKIKNNNEVAKCDSFKIPATNAEDLHYDKRGIIQTALKSALQCMSSIKIPTNTRGEIVQTVDCIKELAQNARFPTPCKREARKSDSDDDITSSKARASHNMSTYHQAPRTDGERAKLVPTVMDKFHGQNCKFSSECLSKSPELLNPPTSTTMMQIPMTLEELCGILFSTSPENVIPLERHHNKAVILLHDSIPILPVTPPVTTSHLTVSTSIATQNDENTPVHSDAINGPVPHDGIGPMSARDPAFENAVNLNFNDDISDNGLDIGNMSCGIRWKRTMTEIFIKTPPDEKSKFPTSNSPPTPPYTDKTPADTTYESADMLTTTIPAQPQTMSAFHPPDTKIYRDSDIKHKKTTQFSVTLPQILNRKPVAFESCNPFSFLSIAENSHKLHPTTDSASDCLLSTTAGITNLIKTMSHNPPEYPYTNKTPETLLHVIPGESSSVCSNNENKEKSITCNSLTPPGNRHNDVNVATEDYCNVIRYELEKQQSLCKHNALAVQTPRSLILPEKNPKTQTSTTYAPSTENAPPEGANAHQEVHHPMFANTPTNCETFFDDNEHENNDDDLPQTPLTSPDGALTSSTRTDFTYPPIEDLTRTLLKYAKIANLQELSFPTDLLSRRRQFNAFMDNLRIICSISPWTRQVFDLWPRQINYSHPCVGIAIFNLIFTNICEPCQTHIIDCSPDARTAILTLRRHCAPLTQDHIERTRESFYSIKQGHQEVATSYLNRIRTLSRDCYHAGITNTDADIIKRAIHGGSNHHFYAASYQRFDADIRRAELHDKELPTFAELESHLLNIDDSCGLTLPSQNQHNYNQHANSAHQPSSSLPFQHQGTTYDDFPPHQQQAFTSSSMMQPNAAINKNRPPNHFQNQTNNLASEHPRRQTDDNDCSIAMQQPQPCQKQHCNTRPHFRQILQTMQIKGVLQIISAHPMLQILHATIVDNLATMLIDA